MATDCRPISQSICLRWPSPLRVDRRDAAATAQGWVSCRKPFNQPQSVFDHRGAVDFGRCRTRHSAACSVRLDCLTEMACADYTRGVVVRLTQRPMPKATNTSDFDAIDCLQHRRPKVVHDRSRRSNVH